jgi:hypothetical protein
MSPYTDNYSMVLKLRFSLNSDKQAIAELNDLLDHISQYLFFWVTPTPSKVVAKHVSLPVAKVSVLTYEAFRILQFPQHHQ